MTKRNLGTIVKDYATKVSFHLGYTIPRHISGEDVIDYAHERIKYLNSLSSKLDVQKQIKQTKGIKRMRLYNRFAILAAEGALLNYSMDNELFLYGFLLTSYFRLSEMTSANMFNGITDYADHIVLEELPKRQKQIRKNVRKVLKRFRGSG